MKLVHRDGALAMQPEHVNLGVEGNESDRQVAWINGDARVAAAEQGMAAVDAPLGRTATAGLALIAGERLAATEIGATGPLQEVAAKRCHIAELL